MNRVLRTALVSASVLLSGTVAFAVAAAIAPPGVDGVDVVVTNRPVLSAAAAETPRAATTATATTTLLDRPEKRASTKMAPPQNKTVVTDGDSGTRPNSAVAPTLKPRPPVNTVGETESDREVVTPPVRDDDHDEADDDDDDDDERPSDSSPSIDTENEAREDISRPSGTKGD